MNYNMNIVTVFTSFANKGGAEDMAISIALGLNQEGKPIIFHQDPIVCEHYRNRNVEFQKLNLKNIYRQHKHGAIFLSHHRRTTTLLILISKLIFGGRLKIIHVAHNTFSSLRNLTKFPLHNIAVSNTVKENMISYFKLREDSIKVIYNGIADCYKPTLNNQRINEDTINILFLGRIDPVKRQVEFVKATKGNLSKNIKIYFGGTGKDLDNLKNAINNDPQYILLGLIDTFKELYKFDYICLFSEKEGLPLSLIEGSMFHKPLITNDLPQCLEINTHGYSGYVTHSWDEVVECINKLPTTTSSAYNTLSNNSRYIFDKLFNYDTMIEKYRQYIDSIVW